MNSYYRSYLELKELYHSNCMFNSANSVISNNLEISFDEKGVLYGKFICSEAFQGYDGMLHGGMASSVIDATMAKCLMGHGVLAYTGRLDIRFAKPIKVSSPLIIRCFITETYKKLYKVKAELTQSEFKEYNVTAKASFYRFVK